MTTQEILSQYEQFVIGNYPRTPLVVTRAEGSYFWDADGNKYLDLFPGWGCSGIGHCHRRVIEAVREQVGRLIHVDNTFYTAEQGKLAQRLSEHSFGGQAFFCNSGAEANEAAVKLARRHTASGRYKIIAMEQSFHGRTYAAMSATGQSKTHEGNEPLLAGFVHVPFDDVDAVAEAVNDETAAILVEPIQGEGGVNVPDDQYLPKLREICDDQGLLLIFDEVQTGCGRTGKWFAYQHVGIEPDIMTLAKALGAGAPIGAMLARSDVAESLTPGSHATTFGANPLVVSAALAMIDVVEDENLLANALQMGEYIRQKVDALAADSSLIESLRGKGLMVGIQLSIPGNDIVAAALQRGLRINCTQGNILRMLPALNITAEQIDQAFEILAEAFADTQPESGP